MATFVIESYLSRARTGDFDRSVADLRRALEAAAERGDRSIRHVRSYYVADDEMAYHILRAASIDVVTELGRAAGLVVDRVVLAVD